MQDEKKASVRDRSRRSGQNCMTTLIAAAWSAWTFGQAGRNLLGSSFNCSGK